MAGIEDPITVIASPGKVLIVGGYLVLNKSYSGLVISVDARVYSAVRTISHTQNTPTSQFSVKVNSFQFTDGFWEYIVKRSVEADGSLTTSVVQVENEHSTKNKFIHTVLETVFWIISHRNPEEINNLCDKSSTVSIVLGTDNDFYSQRSHFDSPSPSSQSIVKSDSQNNFISIEQLQSLPRFNLTNSTIGNVHKTGLGSSAALVSSLTASLLLHFGIVSKSSFATFTQLNPKAKVTSFEKLSTSSELAFKDNDRNIINSSDWHSKINNFDLKLIHNASQFSHCLAQGKIGSGFDVSCAIYGSHIYNRFSPSLIQSAMTLPNSRSVNFVVDPSNSKFDSKVQKVFLPHGLHLVLVDINSGSNTPSMVSKVLAWKTEFPDEGSQIWESISSKNDKVCTLFEKLDQLYTNNPESYTAALDLCSTHPAAEWGLLVGKCADLISIQVIYILIEVFNTSNEIRRLMKRMGDLSGVPIEPDQQTSLIDKCLLFPGVVMAGVPGAGGFDAIYCIVINESTRYDLVNSYIFKENSELTVTPLVCEEGDKDHDGCVLVDTDIDILYSHFS
ncbi:putative phosphomevalonate kinase [Smittium mucronatum]|uniref:Phosphomevalonate kinase n=1 Tax=Smittium mucronatum TaxID=133383 RepID=A0A1R0H0N5_9FUNG|nr:putative phosphomevalonate kinase [Smittium mucronatum]